MKEIFKSIEGYEEEYQVSNFGKVKSLSRPQSRTERVLKEYYTRKYKRVRLSKNNTQRAFQVHRLVALTFIPLVEGKDFVNHIDGNPSNNRVDNLEWCTLSGNMKHAFRIGLQSLKGEKSNNAKLKEIDVINIRKMLTKGRYHKDIAKIYGVSRRCITDINVGNTWAS